jgi:hypothetical protein
VIHHRHRRHHRAGGHPGVGRGGGGAVERHEVLRRCAVRMPPTLRAPASLCQRGVARTHACSFFRSFVFGGSGRRVTSSCYAAAAATAGIPLSSVEVEGAQERGIVVFTLQQLPDGQPFYFDHKSRLTIARMGDNLYAINGAPPPRRGRGRGRGRGRISAAKAAWLAPRLTFPSLLRLPPPPPPPPHCDVRQARSSRGLS